MDDDSRRTPVRCPHPTHYRCHCELASVELSRDGYFSCPGCKCSHPHPPRDLFFEFYTIGNAFCPYCVRWYIIEGGDALGIVEIDDGGQRRTRLFTQKESEERKQKILNGTGRGR